MQNIIQAEFFHVPYVRDFGEFMGSLKKRIGDGAPVKTVVRFYDHQDELTQLAKLYCRLEAYREIVMQRELTARGLSRWYWAYERRQRARKVQKLRTSLCVRAAALLQFTAKQELPIAIEKSGHRFRPARQDELHELVESAHAAKSLWMFVFKPNILVADSNTMVTRVM